MRSGICSVLGLSVGLGLVSMPAFAQDTVREFPDDPYMPGKNPPVYSLPDRAGGLFQVNVNGAGLNLVGDAANEPSICQDPTDRRRMAIGWRQFDTIASNFRQAGVAYSEDFGRTWNNIGPLDPGFFRSDPVLASDAAGNFYYQSLTLIGGSDFVEFLFKSTDGGQNWTGPWEVPGGDKAWYIVDAVSSAGLNNQYATWNRAFSFSGTTNFARSTDEGNVWPSVFEIPGNPTWGTLAVNRNGELFIGSNGSGGGIFCFRSLNAWNSAVTPSFGAGVSVMPGMTAISGTPPNPGGLAGQVWIAADTSVGLNSSGYLYMVCSVNPPDADPLDVYFSRSTNNGVNWSVPMRINTDVSGPYNWFATMSVAPNGRIDVVWNQSLPGNNVTSAVWYRSSTSGGVTWDTPQQLTGTFNSTVGWPNQSKIGDYSHMVSDEKGASLAMAATFNGEQDVYFLRIGEYPCNDIDYNNDGIFPDVQDLLDFLDVFGGGPCPTPRCDGLDFNNDGIFPDNDDLFLFLNVFGGGSC